MLRRERVCGTMAPMSDAAGAMNSGEPTSEERTLGMLAHLLGIFTWFIGPLIIWLVKKDSSSFVDDQGKEALNFQITVGIAYLAAGALACATLGFGAPISGVIWVVNLVFCIMATIESNQGRRYRYPLALRVIT
jgi:uncharacterized Tic20 family protein